MELKNSTVVMLILIGFQAQVFAAASIQCVARLPYNNSPKVMINFENSDPKTVFIPGTQILLTAKNKLSTQELCIETTTSVELLASVCGQSKKLTLMTKTDVDGFITIECHQN